MNRIKIGQIGISHEHAAGKMRSLRAMPEVYEIVGVVDGLVQEVVPAASGCTTWEPTA